MEVGDGADMTFADCRSESEQNVPLAGVSVGVSVVGIAGEIRRALQDCTGREQLQNGGAAGMQT